MKNYLVTAIRPIAAGTLNEKHPDVYKSYQQMWTMALASYKKFIGDQFEVIVWDGPVPDVDTHCTENWYAMKELWHSQPCNILWVGADTLMVNPTDIFTLFSSRFPEFRMFNCTDPKFFPGLPCQLNDDVRWYPHTMNENVWEVGEDFLKGKEKADNIQWGFDQIKHNVMYFSQNIPIYDIFYPEFNYMLHQFRAVDEPSKDWAENWNRYPINSARILHLCGSRGGQYTVNLMKQICKGVGIQYE